LTSIFPRLRLWCDKAGLPIIPVRIWPFLFLSSYLLLYQVLIRTNEIGELYLGFGFTCLSLEIMLTNQYNRAENTTHLIRSLNILLVVCLLTALSIQLFPQPDRVKWSLNRSAAIVFPQKGMFRQAETIFDHINRNPKFLVENTHFNEGIILMEMGRTAEAREVLEQSLVEQEHPQQERPVDPEYYRKRGRILNLLERRDEANRLFDKAIELDRDRLFEVKVPATEAKVRWSLAKTLFAKGETEEALKQLLQASDITPYRKTRHRIHRWLSQWFWRNKTFLRAGEVTIDQRIEKMIRQYLKEEKETI